METIIAQLLFLLFLAVLETDPRMLRSISSKLSTRFVPSSPVVPEPVSSFATLSASSSPQARNINMKFTLRLSSERGHSDHGWLNTYHTFSFADYYSPEHMSFGPLRVLNEDRVAPRTGFPTHPHRDAEIFSYIISGELTHRDSVHGRGNSGSKDDFYVMKRGDVQFTTGGTGIAHSEQNEHNSLTVHFLQIWALPWKRGLTPRYHTQSFDESEKRKAFVKILSPLKAGPNASSQEEEKAEPSLPGTIPIHADLVMGAAIVPAGESRSWTVGVKKGMIRSESARKVYVHLPMTKGGKAALDVNGQAKLSEGDGLYIEGADLGQELKFTSTGTEEAELVLLDVSGSA